MTAEPADPARDAVREIEQGNMLEDQGRLDEALHRYDAAIGLAPSLARAHLNRGNALLALGDAKAATASYQAAIALDARYAAAHHNLGNVLARGGDRAAAIVSYRQAIALKPDFAEAEAALGAALDESGQLEEAAVGYRKALTLAPSAAIYRRLGDVLQRLGRLDEAAVALQDAVRLDPASFELHLALGIVQQRRAQLAESAQSYEQALAINPALIEAHSNLGSVCLRLGQLDKAVACQRKALEIDPRFAPAHNNLGDALRDGGWLDEAIASYRRAIDADRGFAYAHVNLGNALRETGNLEGAVASYRDALAIDPDLQEAVTSLLFCMSHDERIGPEALFAEHLRFGDHFEAPLRSSWPVHRNARDPSRCLRVGFVSADLRAHPVAYFVEPLLAQLASYPSLVLHAYSNHAAEDDVTRRLRRQFRHWTTVVGLSHDALAQKIGDDGIDILIDLSGHTGENRLQAFARKPAPIQASWMGYPGTTGLAAMDYYFADAHFLPFRFSAQFTEKIVHLPASVPFLPAAEAPEVNALPALTRGYVTFASFNRPSKVRPAVVALWAGLMRMVPGSQLLLGAMPTRSERNPLVEAFAREGIDASRLRLFPRCDTATYLRLHHDVDLCLDTFPYTGGTTTAHALWMGVPTLSIAGATPAGRQGAALLGQVGLETFLAADAAGFVERGRYFASNLPELAEVRAQLRGRCLRAYNGRPDVIAASVEQALRIMWKRWCDGLPPEAFSVPPPETGSSPRVVTP